MKKIIWGIIGCGNVTEVKSGPAFQMVKNSSLLAVMRRDKAKAKDYAIRHKVPLYFDDAKDILTHKDINAIYIATPPSTHLEYALAALKVGKNVYLEKPMTLNSNEANILCEALRISTAKLTVAHYRRRLPMFLKVKALIDENAIGTISAIDVRLFQSRKAQIISKSKTNWRINPSISGGGYFHDLAPHQIDLLLFWFGNVNTVTGDYLSELSDDKVATKVNGIINFENAIRCNAHWNFTASENEQIDKCVITGTGGSITFPFFGNEVILESQEKTKRLTFEHPKHIQQPIIQATVNYFFGKGSNPCSVEDGLKGMQIIDAFTS